MAAASAGFELPATSLMAPLLLAIPRSPTRARASRGPDTSRPGGWQYESRLVPAGFRLQSQGLRARSAKRDGVDVAAVVGLGPMGGATIAEKPLRIAVGAVAEVLDLPDSGPAEPRRDIAAEVEHGVVRPLGRRE